MNNESLAAEIWAAALSNLNSRAGFDEFWEGIDYYTQEELNRDMVREIQAVLDKA